MAFYCNVLTISYMDVCDTILQGVDNHLHESLYCSVLTSNDTGVSDALQQGVDNHYTDVNDTLLQGDKVVTFSYTGVCARRYTARY